LIKSPQCDINYNQEKEKKEKKEKKSKRCKAVWFTLLGRDKTKTVT